MRDDVMHALKNLLEDLSLSDSLPEDLSDRTKAILDVISAMNSIQFYRGELRKIESKMESYIRRIRDESGSV